MRPWSLPGPQGQRHCGGPARKQVPQSPTKPIRQLLRVRARQNRAVGMPASSRNMARIFALPGWRLSPLDLSAFDRFKLAEQQLVTRRRREPQLAIRDVVDQGFLRLFSAAAIPRADRAETLWRQARSSQCTASDPSTRLGGRNPERRQRCQDFSRAEVAHVALHADRGRGLRPAPCTIENYLSRSDPWRRTSPTCSASPRQAWRSPLS